MAVWETAINRSTPVYGVHGSPSFGAVHATRSDEGVGALIRPGERGALANANAA